MRFHLFHLGFHSAPTAISAVLVLLAVALFGYLAFSLLTVPPVKKEKPEAKNSETA